MTGEQVKELAPRVCSIVSFLAPAWAQMIDSRRDAGTQRRESLRFCFWSGFPLPNVSASGRESFLAEHEGKRRREEDCRRWRHGPASEGSGIGRHQRSAAIRSPNNW